MNRDDAWKLLNEHLRMENLVKHCLATEAIMRALAERLGKDKDTWCLAGLLHDLDFERTQNEPAKHTIETAAVLEKHGIASEIIQAIKAHNAEALGFQRQSDFEHALAAAETVTGLIVATALVYPDKKLASVKPSSITKRMKRKDFARGVNRDIILECEKLGLTLDQFVELSLTAMQGVAGQLGL